jgi:hypothetical protein
VGVDEDVVKWAPNSAADLGIEEVLVDGLGEQILIGSSADLGGNLRSWNNSAEVLEVCSHDSVGGNTRLPVEEIVEDLGSGSEDFSLVYLVKHRLLHENT